MSLSRALIVVWFCAAAGGTWQLGAQGVTTGGSALFEPLYSNDAPYTSDAHTVTANQQESSFSRFKQIQDRRLPPTIDDDNSLAQYVTSATGTGARGASATTDSITKTTPSHSAFSRSIPTKIVSTGPFNTDYLTSLTAATPAAPTVATSKQTEAPPTHWSALENYYQKMRQEAVRKQLQDAGTTDEQRTFLGLLINDAFNDHNRDLKQYQRQRQRPIYDEIQVSSQGANLPPLSYGQSGLQYLAPGQANIQSADRPPTASVLPDFGLSNSSPLSPPPQSISSGVNNWSPRPPVNGFSSATGGGQPPRQSFEFEQRPFFLQSPGGYQPRSSINKQIDRSQSTGPELVVPIIEQEVIDLPNSVNYDDYVPPGGRHKSQPLPDSLVYRMHQNRLDHQKETFGTWWDVQRGREQLREEAYCGPRNYVNYKPSVASALRAPIKVNGRGALDEASLRELLQSQTTVPISLTAGEYPSHMGLYNGTAAGDDNFICGATWLSERFALTLASCIRNNTSMQYNDVLTIRAGEWNVGRPKGNKTTPIPGGDKLFEESMVTRQVERVHLFPRYEAGSGEHNLALVEWAKPIDFLEVPYICPACQAQLRNSLQGSVCWAPVRSVSFSEHFDAEGEGETKLKRTVGMTEVPVKLYANRESECKDKTGLEYFDLRYPNYICSGNVRQAPWRAKLNQTDHFGSGIYCNEGGVLNLVSIVHPIRSTNSSAYGYLDLSYYKPWIRKVISGYAY